MVELISVKDGSFGSSPKYRPTTYNASVAKLE